MNRMWIKRLALSVTAALLLSLLAACSGSKGGADAPASSPASSPSGQASGQANEGDGGTAIDTSKKAELVWYLLGDAHADTDAVMAELNKLLAEEINATIKLNFTSWADWQTKYNLLLQTGEKIDMIFASTWADFYKLAGQGAFLPLDDLLPVYAPRTWDNVPEQDWFEASVKGKIYGVPSTYPEFTPDGIVYREDWRKELNLPEVKDLASIEAYLDGVKTQKGVTPINGKAYNEINTLFRSLQDYQSIGGDSGVVVASSYDTPRDILAYPFTQEFEDWAKKMKTWAEKGYWNSDTLSSQAEAGDAIKVDNGAVYWRNAPGAGGYIMSQKTENPQIELGYFPFNRFHNHVVPTLSIQNGMAIPKSAANPERTLMALDLIRNNQKFYDLFIYGFEGTHYDIGEDGRTAVMPPASRANDPDYGNYDFASWGVRVESMQRVKQAGGWPEFDQLLEEFKATAKPNIFAGVQMDFEPVRSEQAAVNSVIQQYGMPLMMGLVPDVDKGLAAYRKQLEAAGIQKVVDYVKEKADEHFTAIGVN